MLLRKDTRETRIIHSSDFNSAITDLGFTYGSEVVQDILIHCKLDRDGNIDFSQFEEDITRQRRVHNDQQAAKQQSTTRHSSSAGVIDKPWRSDSIHMQKAQATHQTQLVQEYRTSINELFTQLSHHKISNDAVLDFLRQKEIYPTAEFRRVLQNMEINEVSFSEFIRSLTSYDPNQTIQYDNFCGSGGNQIAVAGCTNQSLARMGMDMHESMGSHKAKRSNPQATNVLFDDTALIHKEKAPLVRSKKMFHNTGSINNTKIDSKEFYKGNSIKEVLFLHDDPSSLLSHAQLEMVSGIQTSEAFKDCADTSAFNVSFNSEEKLQRQQIIAALRKLDSGEMDMDTFHERLFSMGFDLPQKIAADLNIAVQSGKMEITRFVSLLDTTVFKNNVLEDRMGKLGAMQGVFKRVIDAFLRQGYAVVQNLVMAFRRMDSDGDGCLSFQEFFEGCRTVLGTSSSSGVDEGCLRMFFNHFDKNGDGRLDFDEFINAINGDSYTSVRAKWALLAFRKLDRSGCKTVLLQDIMDVFRADCHPSVVAGELTEKKAANEFVQWFTSNKTFDGFVTAKDFDYYYSSLSSSLPTDAAFIDLVQKTWDLVPDKAFSTDPERPCPADYAAVHAGIGGTSPGSPEANFLLPPPPEYRPRHNQVLEPPTAKQSHGDLISWSQQESNLEQSYSKQNMLPLRKIVPLFEQKKTKTDVILWKDYQKLMRVGSDEDETDFDLKTRQIREAQQTQGGVCRTALRGAAKNMSTTCLSHYAYGGRSLRTKTKPGEENSWGYHEDDDEVEDFRRQGSKADEMHSKVNFGINSNFLAYQKEHCPAGQAASRTAVERRGGITGTHKKAADLNPSSNNVRSIEAPFGLEHNIHLSPTLRTYRRMSPEKTRPQKPYNPNGAHSPTSNVSRTPTKSTPTKTKPTKTTPIKSNSGKPNVTSPAPTVKTLAEVMQRKRTEGTSLHSYLKQ